MLKAVIDDKHFAFGPFELPIGNPKSDVRGVSPRRNFQCQMGTQPRVSRASVRPDVSSRVEGAELHLTPGHVVRRGGKEILKKILESLVKLELLERKKIWPIHDVWIIMLL